MKKLIITIGLLSLINGVQAQTDEAPVPGGYIGVRYMPTYSSFSGFYNSNNQAVQGTVVLGYGFGGILGVNLSNNVGLQGEVLYNSLAQKYTDVDNIQRTVNLSYINIPLLLVLNTGVNRPVNLNVCVGPQLGLNVGSSVTSSGTAAEDTLTGVLSVNKDDLGVAFGAGLDFALTSTLRLSIGYRGVRGLVDISNTSNNITTNQYYILDRSHVSTDAGYIGLTILF